MNHTDLVKKYENLLDHREGFHLVLERFDSVVKNSNSNFPIIEVGTNRGGSALCFLEVMKKYNKSNWFYSIDPYGNIPYHDGSSLKKKSQYGNERYRKAMKKIYDFVNRNELNYYHFKSTSIDFIKHDFHNFREHDNINAIKFDKFLFVFLDGSHDPEVVSEEIRFFMERIENDGCIIIDDTNGRNFVSKILENRGEFKLDSIGRQRSIILKIKENK